MRLAASITIIHGKRDALVDLSLTIDQARPSAITPVSAVELLGVPRQATADFARSHQTMKLS